MKNKSQGFITLTFVLFIATLLSFLVISDSADDSILTQQLTSSEIYYDNYFASESCKNISLLHEQFHALLEDPVCIP